MRKGLLIVSLFVVTVFSGYALLGCGTTGTSETAATTTTTLVSGAAAGDAAKDAVTAVMGVAGTSSSVGDLAGSTPTVGSSIFSVTAFDATTPDAFFESLPTDGWITFEGAGFVTGETVQIRMYTAGGELINRAFLTSKKIATMEGFDWLTMSEEGGFSWESFVVACNNWLSGWDPASPAAFYATASKYRSLDTLWDYIVWAHISGHMEDAINGAYASTHLGVTLEAYPSVSTPEATLNDRFGTQEVLVTGTYPDGSTSSLTMTTSTGADGQPVSASGSGTWTRADGVVMTVNSMTVTFDSSGNPESGTMDITVGEPDNLHMILTMAADGSSTGTVYSTETTPETEIGTVVIYATPTDANGDGTLDNGYFQETGGTRHYF